MFVTTKGFSEPARALIRSWGKNPKIRCGIAQEKNFVGIDGIDCEDKGNQDKTGWEKVYFGIFTCKGGVGKTTIAGHLAGAFALQGLFVSNQECIIYIRLKLCTAFMPIARLISSCQFIKCCKAGARESPV